MQISETWSTRTLIACLPFGSRNYTIRSHLNLNALFGLPRETSPSIRGRTLHHHKKMSSLIDSSINSWTAPSVERADPDELFALDLRRSKVSYHRDVKRAKET